MTLLATSYPLWFSVAIWVVVYSPLIPGSIALIVGLVKMTRKTRQAGFWLLAAAFLLGIGYYYTRKMLGAI